MTLNDTIINNRKSLLIYAERHGISKACKTFSVSRTQYYKLKEQLIKTGSLAPRIRKKPKMPNAMLLSRKKLLLELVKKYPMYGSRRYAYELNKQGVALTHICIYHHLKRFGLNKRYKRLLYIEQVKKDNKPITETTLRSFKRKSIKSFEGFWPGHAVALDTFYVGNLKGVGRIYQMSGIDICSRYGLAKLYTNKEQKSSLDFVENTLIPKFYANNCPIESIVSDNGKEFTGSQFQKMLSDYDIKPNRIPQGKPIYNGYCERFQRTILEEFYQPNFRKRFFQSLDELQEALNDYLYFYNFKRPHFGLLESGGFPIDFLISKKTILQKRFAKIVNTTR